MSIIKFTRLEYPRGIVRRYGDFWFEASRDGRMLIHGAMTISAAMHGDKEIEVIAEEAQACVREAGLVGDGLDLSGDKWIKRGAGVHPKAGPFIAYKAQGLIIKITGKHTDIIANPCLMPSATSAKEFLDTIAALIGDRDEVRVAALRARRDGAVQEES